MDKLYKLLKKNNIKLAIGIYPYPNQLLYDSLNSKQIKIWENFCISRCSNFLNFFPVLFNNQNMLDYDLAIKIKNNNFFKNDTNLNEIGNQKIANEFKKLYKN